MLNIDAAAQQVKALMQKDTATKQIMEFLAEHPDSVDRRKNIAEAFKGRIPARTVRSVLGRLAREDKIGRYRVPGQNFSLYGTLEAVSKLKKQLEAD